MRLGKMWDGFDCGCDSRRSIMFTEGKLGQREMFFMAALAGLVVAAIIMERKHK